MATLDQINSNFQFAVAEKHNLKKAFEDLQSHSSSIASLTLQWEELQTHFDSVQSSIERRFERLESKEIQLRSLEIALDRRAKELELKEWQLSRPIVQSRVKSEPLEDVPVNSEIDRSSWNATIRFYVTMDGRNLQLFLNKNACNHGKMGNEVFAALRMSADPAKLVLDAMEGFYPPHLEDGDVEFEGATVRRSCVLLLEQLKRVGPPITPRVRDDAAKLAHEWKAKMGVEVGDSFELLGFLWLLVAYGLASDFDKNIILKLFEKVVQHRGANEVGRALGLTNHVADNMTNYSPLTKILDDNRLKGPNYFDWKRNLTIALTAEKLIHVLDEDPPSIPKDDASKEEKNAYFQWHKHNSLAKCYILESLENRLQKQHENLASAKEIMNTLKEMFGQHNCSERQHSMTGLMSTKMVEGTQVHDHVMKMTGFINDSEALGSQMDQETKIDANLSSLPDPFNQLVLNFNMNDTVVTHPEHRYMLPRSEDLIKKDRPVVLMSEKLKSSMPKNYKRKFVNNKSKKSALGKKAKKDKSEDVCHFCEKSGHWKRNCYKYLTSLKKEKPFEGGSVLFQVLTNQSPSENLELKNAVASSPARPWPELKHLCINMDGKGLRLFLNEHVKEHDFIRCEVYHALRFAPDPAKLVVDILQVFNDPRSELNKGFKMGVVRNSCILLLEQLFRISPSIEPHVKEAAMKLAVDWKGKFVKKYEVPQKVLGFYLLLAVYGLTSSFDPDELLGLLMNIGHSKKLKVTPDLCSVLGLADKIPKYIQDLIERNLLSDAIRYIHIFEVVDKFPPVHILKSYLNDSKWRTFKDKENLDLKEDDILNKEITALREVIRCITEHHLESEYPLGDLHKRIEQLKKNMEGRKADEEKFLKRLRRRKAVKICHQVVPKPKPPQQSMAEPQLPNQNAPASQLPQQSAPEIKVPDQNGVSPQCLREIAASRPPQESFLAPQMLGESGPKSEPRQQSEELKPQEPEITNTPKPLQPPQQSGNKRPRPDISEEATPPGYFGSSPTPHPIQWPIPYPLGFVFYQPAPYSSMPAGHYGTPDGPYGVSGIPRLDAHGIAANGFSMPFGPVRTLPGGGRANPNAFGRRYPRDALRWK